MNRAGGETGLTLSFDRSTVSHWLSGTRPRGATPQLIAEALSRRLDRPVSLAEAGLSPAPAQARSVVGPPGAMSDEDIGETLRRLAGPPLGGKAPTPRDRFAYQVTSLDVPGLDFSVLSRPVARRRPERGPTRGRAVDRFEVDVTVAVAEIFHRSDAAFGGGHGRRALAGYIAAELGPKLRRPATPELRRRLLSVVGQLICLCAFMHFDDNLHATAQHYYLTALRLAAENNAPLEYAFALCGLSVQADALGHRRKALALAETAAATFCAHPVHGAFLHGQLAVAHARNHSRHEAFQALAEAEHLLSRATSLVDTVVGRYHQASLLRQEAVVREAFDDRAGALKALESSLRQRPPEERRSHALTLAEIGRLQAQTGHLSEALRTWHRFVNACPALTAGRIDAALTDVRGQLRSYSHNIHARTLLQRIAHLTSQSGPGPA
ncbi:hypothetical protein [Streptomyces sp. NPDC014733]|uniref:hypothetical protein n=1 Tax=Streptomyces sp. NPDC014733 TaxID=3364885 RepID=UPI003702E755